MQNEGLAAQEAARHDALKAIAALRREASAEIDRLIAFMDETDGYSTSELEAAIDDGPCDENELEKNLSGVNAQWVPDASGDKDGDLEQSDGDDEPSVGFDGLEVDACDDEPDQDNEPNTLTPQDIRKARGRKAKGVGVQRQYTAKKITNLTARQRKLLGKDAVLI